MGLCVSGLCVSTRLGLLCAELLKPESVKDVLQFQFHPHYSVKWSTEYIQ